MAVFNVNILTFSKQEKGSLTKLIKVDFHNN